MDLMLDNEPSSHAPQQIKLPYDQRVRVNPQQKYSMGDIGSCGSHFLPNLNHKLQILQKILKYHWFFQKLFGMFYMEEYM